MSASLLSALDEQAARHPEALPVITELRRLSLEGGGFTIEPWKLAHAHPELRPDAETLLEALTPPLVLKVTQVCAQCGVEPVGGLQSCLHCQADLSSAGAVREVRSYRREGKAPRSVDWLLLLHGMKTRGVWQEKLSWLVARSYGRMVGVAIYKYGYVVTGVLMAFRHRQLVEEVAQRIKERSQEAKSAGFRNKPDVIAHSFGTWLLGHALQKHRDLKVGRVVLTGSILRPDFDWRTLKERGQVEEVINHRGTRDFWAGIAHYVIPDTGPSGRYGFNGTQVLDRPEKDFEHCQFFEDDHLESRFNEVWEPFLQRPTGELASLGESTVRSDWRPTPWPFQAALASKAILVALALLLLIGISALILGLIELPGALRAWTA